MPAAANTSRVKTLMLVALLASAIGLTVYKAATAPITYDEAYTYLRFARQHTGAILRNYEYPNNHMLHTIAVRVSTRWFGDGLLAIRLPGLIGGIALLAAFVAIGRRFDEPVGTVWPIGAAWLPIVLEYNGLARGYSLGAAACFWAAYLLIGALDTAKHATPRSRRQNLSLVGIGLLLGIAIGCVPTFGLFVAALLAATALIRFIGVRPVRWRDAAFDGLLIATGIIPVLVVVYGHVRLKPREWPWGFGNWQACNRAFWEHTLQWPGAMSSELALTLSGVVALAALMAIVSAFRRRETPARLLFSTLVFGIIGLICARWILGTVWPLPRTIHWLAPFCLLAILVAIRMCIRSRYASTIVAAVLVAGIVAWSAARWDSRRFAGWEDNADIPAAIDAIERDALASSDARERPPHPSITVAVPWQFDVCAEYAVRSRPQVDWQLLTQNGERADYAILGRDDATPATAAVLFGDAASGVRAVRRK